MAIQLAQLNINAHARQAHFQCGMTDLGGLLEQVDMSAIPDPDDKLNECEYFLNLASRGTPRARRRGRLV
ncbi:hypothetical protein SAMN05216428_11650 [Nitrosospira sp. Nsp11]|uniref:hypothetical protein n=1 Tax=Nitrosospira sp. Nsp11 TaxID=1855338 RepID=UPI0009230276|nr:hypothetical protein [Nitrosospira sp. Nsp11]SHM18702.1 hypothetical protein SAMN05216428_11650 [Nitrosospira sp. Nsp11]